MKTFAFFLPQFHEIPENNKWWGDGFTEWTNVKKAKPLFRGHKQPKHPTNGIYYNLLEKDTMIWQTELMHNYHVDGLIYYHYYFNGKMLLEKPAENLLKWKDIDQPFFFCWANHDWRKTWNGTKELLQEQTYGVKEDWEKHFKYLLDFFKDSRYEKKENKPIFMIFKSDFDEKDKLFEYFDKRCKEEGFNGLYLIETYHPKLGMDWKSSLEQFVSEKAKVTQRVFLRENTTSYAIYYSSHRIDFANKAIRKFESILFRKLKKNYMYRLSAEKLFRVMIDYEPYGAQFVHGLFFSWDNTPRHGWRGSIVLPPKKKTYFKFMNKLVSENQDYVFFNAWNEWCEGMILEPTKEEGYRYLEWIKEWYSTYAEFS